MRRIVMVATCATLTAALVSLTIWGFRARAQPAQAPSLPQPATEVVRRGTLVDREQFDAALGFGDTRPVANRKTGIVTQSASEGATVRPGDAFYAVDAHPVIDMDGTFPAYRPLATGVSDGRDVKQLERNLRALGFDPGHQMIVDQHWTATTTAAVKRWQKSLRVAATGSVDLGDVVFLPGPRRVAHQSAAVGSTAAPMDAFLTTTSLARSAMLSLDARRTGLVKVRQRVQVTFPDGTVVTGRISTISRTATSTADDKTPKVSVEVAVPAGSAGGFDQLPVTIGLEREVRKNILIVPVIALTATSGGHYAVGVVSGTQIRVLPVEVGLIVNGEAEVTGPGVSEGAKVEVAA
jgi:membrane fusion protein, multidrug efflux system